MPNKAQPKTLAVPSTDQFPSTFICPLTKDVMVQPMMTRSGISFEKFAIMKWLTDGNKKCPVTGDPLTLSDLIRNRKLENQLERVRVFCGVPDPSETTTSAYDDFSCSYGHDFSTSDDIDNVDTSHSIGMDFDLYQISIPSIEKRNGSVLATTVKKTRSSLSSSSSLKKQKHKWGSVRNILSRTKRGQQCAAN